MNAQESEPPPTQTTSRPAVHVPALHKLLRKIGFHPRPPIYSSFLQWLLTSIPLGVIWAGVMNLLFWHRVPILAQIGLGAFFSVGWALSMWGGSCWQRKKQNLPPWSEFKTD